MLHNFPKKRKELPDTYKKIYTEHYLNSREGKTKATSMSAKMEIWLHKKIAEDVKNHNASTLEIGAGTLNQLKYEQHIFPYDIVEPFEELYKNSELLLRIRNVFKDIGHINENEKYERITSVATFEHIENLPEVVAKSALLLIPCGNLRVSIPNEGTILWNLGTKITGYEFKKKYNLEYKTLMEYEHINTADEIEIVLKYFFSEIKCKVMGISKKLAFYRFYECKLPKTEVARKYLSEIKTQY